jgi:hypothetical protein
MATTLATQGTTIEQAAAAAPGNERVHYAQRIARAMGETANPPTAIGADGKILVPSSDPAKCIIWGSMWFRDTAEELRQLGFSELRCDSRVWKL